MTGTAFYNEYEPFPAEWTRNLIAADLVAPGIVDTRSIAELQPEDVRHATQAHFFSGIAVWSAAARAAGWPDGLRLWSGSCPCQSFSDAGAGRGFADERHLWPEWFRLIRECRPPVVVGEQVASKAALAWLDVVCADLEGAGYAIAAADFCAASLGAPHIRQRLYFVAIRVPRCPCDGGYCTDSGCDWDDDIRAFIGDVRALAHHHHHRRQELGAARLHDHGQRGDDAARRGADGAAAGDRRMADADLAHAGDGREPTGGRLVQPAAHAATDPDRGGLADCDELGAAWGGRTGTSREPDPHGAHGGLPDADDERRRSLLGLVRTWKSEPEGRREVSRLPDAARDGRIERVDGGRAGQRDGARPADDRGLGDAGRDGDPQHTGELRRHEGEHVVRAADGHHSPVATGAVSGYWGVDAVWLPCTDGKARPACASIFPLASRTPNRVGRLRAYGNSIVLPQATAFLEVVLDILFDLFAPEARTETLTPTETPAHA